MKASPLLRRELCLTELQFAGDVTSGYDSDDRENQEPGQQYGKPAARPGHREADAAKNARPRDNGRGRCWRHDSNTSTGSFFEGTGARAQRQSRLLMANSKVGRYRRNPS